MPKLYTLYFDKQGLCVGAADQHSTYNGDYVAKGEFYLLTSDYDPHGKKALDIACDNAAHPFSSHGRR